jgi:predicted DNA-binding transcriptional regulator YafY
MALLLAASRYGLSIDELSEKLEVERRTVERLRDSLQEIIPGLDYKEGDDRKKRWFLPGDALGPLAMPRPEAIAALETLARECEGRGESDRAVLVREAANCLLAGLRPKALCRVEPDVEALMVAEGTAMQPGPRPVLPHDLLATLRRAILGPHPVALIYAARGKKPRSATVLPLGILRGGRGWLVALTENKPGVRLWRLDGIREPKVLDRFFVRPPDFDLQAYASQSFGVFQEPPLDVVLRIAASAAETAEGWVFHPTQSVSVDADGALIVRFRAGGAVEMCGHFATWGPALTILAPDSLREAMAAMTAELAAHHALQSSPGSLITNNPAKEDTSRCESA